MTTVAVLAAALTVGALPSVAQAGGGDPVRQGLERLVREDRYPAALASTTDQNGRVRNYAAGVADLKTKTPAPVDGQVRVGSNTKTFTATVVLQLVGEGKVALDSPSRRTCRTSSGARASTGVSSKSASCSSTPADCPTTPPTCSTRSSATAIATTSPAS